MLVFDKDGDIIKQLHKLSPKPHEKWILFPLFNDEEIVRKIKLYLESQGCLTEKIQLQKEINETALSLRNEYIHFIYIIGEKRLNSNKSIKSWFKYPFCNFSLWWPSLVAEKNTMKSAAFHDLTKAYSILRQIKQRKVESVLLYMRNRAILNSLTEWGKNNNINFMNIGSGFNISKGVLFYYLRAIRSFIIYINRIVMIKLKMHKSHNLRMQDLKNIEYFIITYFPLVDSIALKEKQFVNKLFQPLQNALKKQRIKYAWGANIVHYDEYKLKDSIKLGKNINKWNETLFFWEEALKFRDLVLVVLIFHWISLKYLFFRKKIKKFFIFEKDEIKINAWRIFKNECDDSFGGSVLIFNLLHYKIFKRIFKHLSKETVILFPAEMQGWEKAMCAAAIETGRIKTVAIQHTMVPIFELNYFFDKNEIESKYEKGGMPKPYRWACVGNIPKRLLMESGWQSNNVFIIGGIRFNHYAELFKKNIRWATKKNKIIVALAIHPEEAKEVISICLEAFSKEEGISVVFKGHPYTPVLPLLDSLKIGPLKPQFSISDAPLSNLLLDAKIMIVTGSSATLEGLACHCQVIIPRLANALDLNPLTSFTDLPIYVNSPNELRRIAKDIIQQENPPYPSEKAFDFLKQYITFRSRDEEFLECIELFCN